MQDFKLNHELYVRLGDITKQLKNRLKETDITEEMRQLHQSFLLLFGAK